MGPGGVVWFGIERGIRPFCATFHETYETVRKRYPNDVALTFVHYPLPMHRFAVPAARVAECAGEQGRFAQMHDALFKGQKEFGLKPWSDYAAAAGVPDSTAFQTCIARQDPVPRVAAGESLAKRLDIQGTPTIIINGWKTTPGNAEQLEKMVQRVLSGKNPVST